MAFYYICKLFGRSQIPKGGFGTAPTMSKNCKFFRRRDKVEVDPRSKFILPKLVNKIKELEEEVLRRQTQINEHVIDVVKELAVGGGEALSVVYVRGAGGAVEPSSSNKSDPTGPTSISLRSIVVGSTITESAVAGFGYVLAGSVVAGFVVKGFVVLIGVEVKKCSSSSSNCSLRCCKRVLTR
ncbi:hypothetical protein H5410_055445 [Solanum commersonii]|uniref:Uncharacterized protein n=1 Tax=Solanum commersonii TaxID=4109 RepID=A0A9J5WJ45_SOLCO|nr:hypothetical protein H5410_055445 [Solanum commersonii]